MKLLQPPSRLPSITLKSLGLHPLIYRKRIARVDRDAQPGDLVEVRADEGQVVGYGLYNPKAELALRMLSGPDELPDETFWRRRLEEAVRLRREVLKLEEVTDAYRVVHAEADGLSGLVIDKLGDVLSAECFSIGMYQRAEAIVAMLAEILGTKHWLIRTGPATLAQEGFEGPDLK